MTNRVFVVRIIVTSARTDLYETAELRAVKLSRNASSIVSNGGRLDPEHAPVRAGEVRRVGEPSLVSRRCP
jgi:hypothetical protein